MKNFWGDILHNGTVFISNSRRYIYYQRNNPYMYSKVLWNYSNPKNRLKSGEVIHHKDFDSLNDVLSNYEKLSRSDHMRIHSSGENNPFFGKKHSVESREVMSKKAFLRKSRPPSRKGVFYSLPWDVDRAIRLRLAKNGWASIAVRVGTSEQNVKQALSRRGIT